MSMIGPHRASPLGGSTIAARPALTCTCSHVSKALTKCREGVCPSRQQTSTTVTCQPWTPRDEAPQPSLTSESHEKGNLELGYVLEAKLGGVVQSTMKPLGTDERLRR